MNKQLHTDITIWTSSIENYWQKYACLKILEGYEIDTIINECWSNFEKEVINGENINKDTQLTLKNKQNEASPARKKLSKIQNIRNVNALTGSQVIELSDSLTVIYGNNGSGKSSYTRLFNSRGDKRLMPNIFSNKVNNEPYCEFLFNDDTLLKYPNDKDRIEFSQYAVFDNTSSKAHLDKENNLLFTPDGFDFFNKKKELFERLKNIIDKKILEIKKPNKFINHFIKDNIISYEIRNLNPQSNLAKIRALGDFNDSDKNKVEQLINQKNKLNPNEVSKQINELEKLKQIVNDIQKNVKQWNSLLSKTELDDISDNFLEFKTCQELVKYEDIEGLKSYNIEKVESQTWRAFIQAALDYVEDIRNYKLNNQNPANELAQCPFCLQKLSFREIEIINKYWILLKSQATQNLKKITNQLNEKYITIKKFNIYSFSDDNLFYQFLTHENPSDLEAISKVFKIILETQRDILALFESKALDKIPKFNEFETNTIDKWEITLEAKLIELKKININQKVEAIDNELNLLRDKEKLSSFLSEIETYVEQLKWISKAESAKSKLNSIGITKKQGELFSKYITEKYIQLFKDECLALDAPKTVDVTQKQSNAQTLRRLKIKDYDPTKILSEGEQRVIALADFLTEIQLDESNQGIIFDDPVTSLDDERKYLIAKRLSSEARQRQVIIFTHDLVFVETLKFYSKEYNVQPFYHWIEKNDSYVGVIWTNNAPSLEKDYKTTDKAENYYKEAKNQSPELREMSIRNGFAALRTSYEAFVVFDLFNGVVQRFVERVSIDSLSKVSFNNELKEKVIDSFHLCCRFMEGHSHSNKYSYQKPTLNDLRSEIDRFNSLKKEMKFLKNQ